jgi:hypothetical protein
MGFFRQAWEGWKKVAHKIGNFQARVMLGIFYFLLLSPFSIVLTLKDTLALKPGTSHGWHERPQDQTPPIEKALRQF